VMTSWITVGNFLPYDTMNLAIGLRWLICTLSLFEHFKYAIDRVSLLLFIGASSAWRRKQR